MHLNESLSIAIICEGASPEPWWPRISAGSADPMYNTLALLLIFAMLFILSFLCFVLRCLFMHILAGLRVPAVWEIPKSLAPSLPAKLKNILWLFNYFCNAMPHFTCREEIRGRRKPTNQRLTWSVSNLKTLVTVYLWKSAYLFPRGSQAVDGPLGLRHF